MILVDTSIWIDHFRHGDEHLIQLLQAGRVISHSFIIGELALGCFKNRKSILDSLKDLPQAIVATETEVMRFIDENTLFGKGIGFIDVHLLAAARLTPGSRLWTRDKRLLNVATILNLAHLATH
jgi:predicted nucleic acid-binding protein